MDMSLKPSVLEDVAKDVSASSQQHRRLLLTFLGSAGSPLRSLPTTTTQTMAATR
jgi:hypothetical protein